MAFRRGLHVGAYAAEPQQLDFRLQQALDEFVRRHAVLGNAEALLHLRRHFDGLGAALENAATLADQLAVIVRPCRARQVEQPLALRPRSEEHTSELQSLMRTSSAGFCLQKTNTQQ